MIIKSNDTIKDLAGKDIPSMDKEGFPFTVGNALSNILVNCDQGGKMKMFLMAQDFYKEKDVDLDAVDMAIVKQAIETSKLYNNLVLGQLLVTIENAKDAKSKDTKKV